VFQKFAHNAADAYIFAAALDSGHQAADAADKQPDTDSRSGRFKEFVYNVAVRQRVRFDAYPAWMPVFRVLDFVLAHLQEESLEVFRRDNQFAVLRRGGKPRKVVKQG
jgi:hypothetical protein